MSLLDGHDEQQRLNDSEDTQSSYAPTSPLSLRSQDLRKSQNQQLNSDPKDHGSDELDSQAELDQSQDDGPSPLNRFTGQPHQWQRFTKEDRALAVSLQQLIDSDLTAHLYNAHALKRRARRQEAELGGIQHWQSRDIWLKSAQNSQYEDASGSWQNNLVPTKGWTAWPLKPTKRSTNQVNCAGISLRNGRSDGWLIDGRDIHDEGRDLRDEMLATFLQLAKNTWNARQSEDPHSQSTSGTGNMQSSAETLARPAFLADDAKAWSILEPTINSMLSKLDDVAFAVRRTRLNHFGHGTMGSRFSHDEQSDDMEVSARSRSRGRIPGTGSISSSSKGIPKGKAVAKEVDDADWGTSDSANSPGHPEKRKRQRSASAKSGKGTSSSNDEAERIGLMDWSEILGLATVKGWDHKAVARTAQRCADLFGESMSFLHLDMTPESQAEKRVLYAPSVIPPPPIQPAEQSTSRKRPYFQQGSLSCPHLECPYRTHMFSRANRVIEHCIKVHGYDPRENTIENEEKTFGGVHVDGFLQPITLKRGWKGHGRSQSRKLNEQAQEAKRAKKQADDMGDDHDGRKVIADTSDADQAGHAGA